MALTSAVDMIIPAVYADMAQAAFVGKAKVLNSGATLSDNTLVGVPGDTIHFPKWDALTELATLVEGTAMVPETLGTTDDTATILEAGKAVEFTDKGQLVGLGDAKSEAIRQFGVLAARRVDADLIAAAQAVTGAARVVTNATEDAPLAWAQIVDGIATFGDEWDPEDFAGLFVRSDAIAALFKDAQFIDAAKLGTSTTPVKSGVLGRVGGLDVYVSNRLAANTSLLIKRNALGALYKRRPIVEHDRDILKRTDVVTTNLHYAVKLLNAAGVTKLVTTNAV